MAIVGKSIESTQIAFNSSTATDVTFRVGVVSTSVKHLVITTDVDVYLNFDGAADNTCFLLTPGCGQFSIDNISFTTISALGVNSDGSLYILAMRD